MHSVIWCRGSSAPSCFFDWHALMDFLLLIFSSLLTPHSRHTPYTVRRYFDFRGVEGYPVPENPYYGLHHYKQGFGAQFHAYVGQCDRVLHPMRAKLVHTLQKIFVRE